MNAPDLTDQVILLLGGNGLSQNQQRDLVLKAISDALHDVKEMAKNEENERMVRLDSVIQQLNQIRWEEMISVVVMMKGWISKGLLKEIRSLYR